MTSKPSDKRRKPTGRALKHVAQCLYSFYRNAGAANSLPPIQDCIVADAKRAAGALRFRTLLDLPGSDPRNGGSEKLSGGNDRVAILWEIETGREVRLFDAHDSFVLCATFSPDGKSLLTVSRDCTARLWNVSSGQELHRWLFAPYNATEDARKLATTRVENTLASMKGQIGSGMVIPVGLVTSVDFSPTGSEALIGLYVFLPAAMTSQSNPVFLNTQNRRVISVPSAFAARPMSTVRAVFNSDGTAALFNNTREERVRGENVRIDYLSLVGLPTVSDPALIGGDNATSSESDAKPPTIPADVDESQAPASDANNHDAAKVVTRTTGKAAWGQLTITSMSNGDEIVERSTLAGRIIFKSIAAQGVLKEKRVFGASGDELFSLVRGVDGRIEHKVNSSVGTPAIRINKEGLDGRYMRVRVRNLSDLELGTIQCEADLIGSDQKTIFSQDESVTGVSSQAAKDATLILPIEDLARAQGITFRLTRVETTIEKVDADITEWFRVDDASK